MQSPNCAYSRLLCSRRTAPIVVCFEVAKRRLYSRLLCSRRTAPTVSCYAAADRRPVFWKSSLAGRSATNHGTAAPYSPRQENGIVVRVGGIQRLGLRGECHQSCIAVHVATAVDVVLSGAWRCRCLQVTQTGSWSGSQSAGLSLSVGDTYRVMFRVTVC